MTNTTVFVTSTCGPPPPVLSPTLIFPRQTTTPKAHLNYKCTMSLAFLQRHAFGGFVTSHVERRIGAHGVHGIFATAPFEEDSLLACLPPFAGISPASARASEVGRLIERRLKPAYTSKEDARLSISRDSFLVAAMTAVQRQRGPLSLYLQDTTVETEEEDSLRAVFPTEEAYLKCCSVRKILDNLLEEAHEDIIRDNGKNASKAPPTSAQERVELDTIPITLDDLRLANAICESRVVEIPGGEDIFQGPVLMPFIDLINHSDAEPNVHVQAMKVEELGSSKLQESIKGTHCVVAIATRDISPGEELTYHYDELLPPDASEEERAQAMAYWAIRFHFIPPYLRRPLKK